MSVDEYAQGRIVELDMELEKLRCKDPWGSEDYNACLLIEGALEEMRAMRAWLEKIESNNH